jgi:hypothetical protein
MFEASRFFALQPKDIDEHSSWLRPFLEDFESKTHLVTADDVLEQAKRADAQLWSYYDGIRFRGVVATRIHKTSRGLMCNIWVCIGMDATELMDGVYQTLEDWARSLGCYAIEIVGRFGWERKLPGFKRTAIVLEKVLT